MYDVYLRIYFQGSEKPAQFLGELSMRVYWILMPDPDTSGFWDVPNIIEPDIRFSNSRILKHIDNLLLMSLLAHIPSSN